jgi:hypothetical protein
MGKLKHAGLTLAKRPKDRFVKPMDVGYRDVLMNVTLPNGHIGELQLHVKALLNAKENLGGHKHYEVMREIDGRMKKQGRTVKTAEESAAYKKAEEASMALYNPIWDDIAGGEKMTKAMQQDQTQATGPGAATIYYDMEGALLRQRPIEGHVKEIFRPDTGTWAPYYNSKWQYSADRIDTAEALATIEAANRKRAA